MAQLSKILDFLETYRGRDKVLRTLCYTSKYISGLSNDKLLAQKLDNFSGQLSACRAALRLLDDLPMLVYVMEYGLGKKEKDDYIRFSNILANVVDLIFYPIDHISWAIDYNIISCKDSRWGTASTVCWAVSLYLTIAKSIRSLYILSQEKYRLTRSAEDMEVMLQIEKKQRNLMIAVIRASGDIIFAVHYLPKGILWGGTLKKWHVGALGSLSSILGLYQSFS